MLHAQPQQKDGTEHEPQEKPNASPLATRILDQFFHGQPGILIHQHHHRVHGFCCHPRQGLIQRLITGSKAADQLLQQMCSRSEHTGWCKHIL